MLVNEGRAACAGELPRPRRGYEERSRDCATASGTQGLSDTSPRVRLSHSHISQVPLSEFLFHGRPRESGDPYAVPSPSAAAYGSRLCGRFATLAGTTKMCDSDSHVRGEVDAHASHAGSIPLRLIAAAACGAGRSPTSALAASSAGAATCSPADHTVMYCTCAGSGPT